MSEAASEPGIDTAAETQPRPEAYAPKYTVFPAVLQQQIRAELGRYGFPSLKRFSVMAGHPDVPLSVLQYVAARTERMAAYVRSVREPDWEQLTLQKTIDMEKEGVGSSVFTIQTLPDGRIVTTSDMNLVIWSDGKVAFKIVRGVLFPDVCISADGGAVFYTPHVGNSHAIYRIDARTYQTDLVETTERQAWLNSTPDGCLVTTEGIDNGHVRIRVFDPEHPKDGTNQVVKVNMRDKHAVLLSSGLMLCNADIVTNTVGVVRLDPRTGKQVREIRRGRGFTTVAELPDGRIVMDGPCDPQAITADQDTEKVMLEAFDGETGAYQKRINITSFVPSPSLTESFVRQFDVSPKGKLVAFACFNAEWFIDAWDMDNGKWKESVTIPDTPRAIRCTHDGKIIVSGAGKPELYIFG